MTATQYASGYTLDLYCDGATTSCADAWDTFPHTFFAETFAQCAREAKEKGWKIHPRTRTATCPRCVAASAARLR